MAAITGTATDTTASASYTPTASMADVVVVNRGKGKVWLEVLAPLGSWVLLSNSGGAFSVSTSDSALRYRFRGTGQDSDIDFDYYMGP